MTFIVGAPGDWFLRGTTWTHRERAQEFETREAGAIGSAVQQNQIYNACMEANGFVAVDAVQQ
jgi:hypothetical protein